jgi:inosine/xanthosine triphosphatase
MGRRAATGAAEWNAALSFAPTSTGAPAMTSASDVLTHRLGRVAVGSTNPVKIGAVRAVIARLDASAEVSGVAVTSSVPDQPWGDDETIRGAVARARAALAALGADVGVGIEGGVVSEHDGSVRTCAWAAVVGRDGREGVGGSLALRLPERVAALVRGGMELGHAMDAVTGERDVKRGVGAVGILTAGLVDRQAAYEVLVAYALVPLLDASSASSR